MKNPYSGKVGNRNPANSETGIRDSRGQESEDGGSRNPVNLETEIPQSREQESGIVGNRNPANSDLVGSVIIDVQAFQAPSKSTAENTAEISSKITAGEITAESVAHTPSQVVPPLKNFQEEPELIPLRPERGIELPKETQKNPRPEEGYRAEPKDPHEGKFSAAAGANFEKQWTGCAR